MNAWLVAGEETTSDLAHFLKATSDQQLATVWSDVPRKKE